MSESRKIRGSTQNIFLIETIIDDIKEERKYVVMGSTGNVYNVTIKEKPECTCPDFMTRNKRCKHVYFILIKVMKADNIDHEIYSKEALEKMFKNIPQITNNLIVNNNIKNKYDKLKKNEKIEITMKNTDDLCPICLDDLENGCELDFCKYSCGKPVHTLCYAMWIKKKAPNCIYCSVDWYKKEVNSKYINLSKNCTNPI